MDTIRRFYDAERFREEARGASDLLADYLKEVMQPDGKYEVLPHRDPDQLAEKYMKILAEGTGIRDLLVEVLKDSNHLHHPGYIGHQCTAPNPVAALSAMAGALLNNGSAVYEMGPANVAMERAVAQFFATELGYPDTAGGLFTSGGSLGNLTALLAARQHHSPYDIWEEGIRDGDRPVFLVSEGSHYSISRAIKIMGLGEKAVVSVPVDDQYKMRTDLLEEIYSQQLASKHRVVAIVSSACSTATGKYDDLDAISDFCEKYKIWHHVDGAHGGAAILSRKYKHLMKGADRADSIVIDFHKMLMTPGLNTLILFRNADTSYATFAQKASYLLDAGEGRDWYNYAKRTMECTKSMMGFNVFLQLAVGGKTLFSENVERLYDQGRLFAGLCRAENGIDLATEPESNIVCFRFANGDPTRLNELNLKIRNELIKKGDFYIVQTMLNGEQYLRVAVMNPFTEKSDFVRLLAQVKALAEQYS